MKNYLDFEKEIKALEQEVDGLKSPFGSEGITEVDTDKIKNTQQEINQKLEEIYSNLDTKIVQKLIFISKKYFLNLLCYQVIDILVMINLLSLDLD